MESEEVESDIAYKCSFCDVIFPKFESIVKHNEQYCHKRRKLPRSCTITTAMLSMSMPPEGSVDSHGSNAAGYSGQASSIQPHGDAELVPKFDKPVPEAHLMHTPPPNRGYMIPRCPEVVAVVRLSKSGATLLGSHMQPRPREVAPDFKHPTSAALTLQRLHANSRLAASAATLESEHVTSQILQAAAEFMHPTSAAITLQRLQSRIAEAASSGKVSPRGTTLYHDHMNSSVLEAKEYSELPESGTKRKNLSDDDE